MAEGSLKLFVIAACALAVVVCVRGAGEFNCPPSSELRPCRCSQSSSDNSSGSLACDLLVNQGQLSDFINKLKESNPSMTKLKVEYIFITTAPSLTSLDLTPLTHCSIRSLYFDKNPNLTSILPSFSSAKMDVQGIYVIATPLSNVQIGNILTYVDSATGPIRINIENSTVFTGNSFGNQIIPGLSSFPKLTTLKFVNTSIEEILTSAFAGSKGLTLIDLSNHKIKKIGRDAFTIDHDVQNRTFSINLDNNLLQSEISSIEPGFIPELDEAKQLGYFISMQNNNLTTLPEGTFKNLIFPRGRIFSLEVKGNQFVCDDRMQWIKSGDDNGMWEMNVKDVECTNDPGKNIFTTDLVKSKNSASSLFQFSIVNFIIVICMSFRFIF